MSRRNLAAPVLGFIAAAFVISAGGDARSDATPYAGIPENQAEFISSPERIVSIAASGAPMAIWETLEHAEKVECLSCVSAVAPLLYDVRSARTREIAAWWLRRRIFGVFGSGEVYEQTLTTLKSDGDPTRRAFAAHALGEFLFTPGIAACAAAITGDADPTVRTAAALALGRLNDDGQGALSAAVGDADEHVRLAGLTAAGRINSFTDVASVAKLTGDTSPSVRRSAVLLLDAMHAKDSVASVMALAKGDADVDVRIAACHALGIFADASAKSTLDSIAQGDASSLVRDAAQIALRSF